MPVGSQRTLVPETRIDTDTGATITRLTPLDAVCHRNYFYQKCFSNDGNQLLYSADYDGHWNYHLLDLTTQVSTQLTAGAGDNTFGGCLSSDDQYLIYVKHNAELKRVNLNTFEEETCYTVPSDWVGYGTWVPNTDCTKVVGIEMHADDHMVLDDWQKFAELYHKNPRCRLITIDLATGERHVVLDEKTWLGHPIYRPFDDNTIAFCHEGPHDLVETRMWLVDEDGNNVRKVREQSPEEACTHEFWVPDGSKMMFVSYTRGESERWMCSVDAVTGEFVKEYKMPPCSHLMSNHTGNLVVGDGSDTPVDVANSDGHEVENDPFLYVFDLDAKTEKRIAKHNTSWDVFMGDRQINHPHPSFTPDEQQVLYSSDEEGTPSVYLTTV
ncbi:MAG: oligogalacturonate lyase family protein [Pontibacterium sp.]